MKDKKDFTQRAIADYQLVCETANKSKVTRNEYRRYGAFSTHVIEDLFGSWSKFAAVTNNRIVLSRGNRVLSKTVSNNKVVITSVVDGQPINLECWNTIKKYAKVNKCDLVVLWMKGAKSGVTFSKQDYDEISPYLATEVYFSKDHLCTAKDALISFRQKNPLINLDKLSNNLHTIIVASPKQYLKTLPRDPQTEYKVAWSTGTISDVKYASDINGDLDKQNHTFGALVLEYSETSTRYIVRNLMYKNGFMIDLNKIYTSQEVLKEDTIPAMVLGDLHLPEENEEALKSALDTINKLHVREVVLHDIFSFNSISHHDHNMPLTRVINRSKETESLDNELAIASEKLNNMASKCKNSKFVIVHSNHDDFITKYLNGCDFVHDIPNAVTAMEFFIDMARGKNPLLRYIKNDNISFLKSDTSYNVSGFELGQHGNAGICGAKGSAISYSKTYEKSVSGHTHSPATFETSIVVGTNSKMHLSYNNGITNWAHDNVLIHGNGTYQHIFPY